MSESFTPAVRELLAAVAEVLDVPTPNYDDRDAHRTLLMCRAAAVRGYLGAVARHSEDEAYHAESIREIATEYPLSYAPYVRRDPEAGPTAAPIDGELVSLDDLADTVICPTCRVGVGARCITRADKPARDTTAR